jgi:hypothetical protein
VDINLGGGSIISLCADIANPDAIYVATENRVLRRINPQTAFEDLTGNLGLPINVIALWPHRDRADPSVFVGTDAGVFAASGLSGVGTTWERFGMGLPDAPVTDLEITPARQRMIAATWGRGAWAILVPFSGLWRIVANGFPMILDVQTFDPTSFSAWLVDANNQQSQVNGTWDDALGEINFTVTVGTGTPAQETQHYKGFLFDKEVDIPGLGASAVMAGTFTSEGGFENPAKAAAGWGWLAWRIGP